MHCSNIIYSEEKMRFDKRRGVWWLGGRVKIGKIILTIVMFQAIWSCLKESFDNFGGIG